MRAICDKDQTLAYNLARAYHKGGNCNKALFWYEQIQNTTPSGPYKELIETLREKAAIKGSEVVTGWTRVQNDAWQVDLFARNLFDEDYRIFEQDVGAGPVSRRGEPRFWGVSVTARF